MEINRASDRVGCADGGNGGEGGDRVGGSKAGDGDPGGDGEGGGHQHGPGGLQPADGSGLDPSSVGRPNHSKPFHKAPKECSM